MINLHYFNFLDIEKQLELESDLLKNSQDNHIILITSRLKKTYLQSAQKAGVFDFLFLPLDETKLIQILQKCQEEKKRIKKINSISFKLKKDS